MTSAIRGAGTGLLNGFLVWALGTVLILVLSALGLGQLFGPLGNVAGQLGPGGLRNAAGAAQANAPNVSPQEAAQAIRTGAIGAFFGLLLSALASLLGGLIGAVPAPQSATRPTGTEGVGRREPDPHLVSHAPRWL